MSQTVGERVLRRLVAWGVERVYGYPGDGINGVVLGFHKVPELEFVQTRHEFAHPDRPVIAAVGDGAIQMLGINSLIDVARYRDRWRDQRLVIDVPHDDDLNQVTWEQRVTSGDAKLEASQPLPPHIRFEQASGMAHALAKRDPGSARIVRNTLKGKLAEFAKR